MQQSIARLLVLGDSSLRRVLGQHRHSERLAGRLVVLLVLNSSIEHIEQILPRLIVRVVVNRCPVVVGIRHRVLVGQVSPITALEYRLVAARAVRIQAVLGIQYLPFLLDLLLGHVIVVQPASW